MHARINARGSMRSPGEPRRRLEMRSLAIAPERVADGRPRNLISEPACSSCYLQGKNKPWSCSKGGRRFEKPPMSSRVVHCGSMKTPAGEQRRAGIRTNPRLGFQPSPILRAEASERKKRSRYPCSDPHCAALETGRTPPSPDNGLGPTATATAVAHFPTERFRRRPDRSLRRPPARRAACGHRTCGSSPCSPGWRGSRRSP